MKVTSKNLAKLRRELWEGDKVTFLGRGALAYEEFTGTVTTSGSRQADGFARVVLLDGRTAVVDYYRITAWYRNTDDRKLRGGLG